VEGISLVFVLAPIILLAYTTEAFVGFGASIIAVTLGTHFYPIDHLVPVNVLLNVFVSGYIGIRHRRNVDWGLLLKRILPFMGIGLALGLEIYPHVNAAELKWLLGVFVIVFAGRELILIRRKSGSRSPMPQWRAGIFQVLAGITHAFFSTGGPPLVYSLSRLALPKQVFRATLSIVWLTMSIFLIVAFTLNGRIDGTSMELFGLLFPTLPLGILIGEWLHGRANEYYFRLFIYVLLLASGLVLFL
jgi:uncharacterized membrane protein YfcA